MKALAQRVLKGLGLYHRIRASRAYDAFWMVTDRSIIDGRRAEVEFYRRHLVGFTPGNLVFDIGANEGYKSDIFLRMGARVVAVEPEPYSQEVLRKSFQTYRLRKRQIEIVGKAVSDQDAVETMWIDAPGSAKNTLSRKWVDLLRSDDQRFGARLDFGHTRAVPTVSLDTLIATHGVPFFVKIDVEGHEPAVIRGLRHPVPYVSFEVNLPEFRHEGKECVKLLMALVPTGQFNYTADCRRGMAMKAWLGAEEMLSVMDDCPDRSIDVFWRGAAVTASR